MDKSEYKFILVKHLKMTSRLSLLNVSEPHPALHSYCHVLLILLRTAVHGISLELLINGTLNYFFPFSSATVGKGRFYFLKLLLGSGSAGL